MRFSIVVPTLNRPVLLREALSSVAAQTYDDWEVIVVDDGSDPPVARDSITELLGPARLKLIRHDHRRGIPAAKNAGLDEAEGDVVLYLDDDDLLAPMALQTIYGLFRKHPGLDCIFTNVEAFGKDAEGTHALMDTALTKFLDAACTKEDADLYYLGPNAFEALLRSVPLPLQRPAARRSVWNMMGGYCETVPFSEPEWTMRAAAFCSIALTKRPLQRWRVDGQNAYSRPEMYRTGIDSGIGALNFLRGNLASQGNIYHQRAAVLKGRLSSAYLGRAWFVWESEKRTDFEALWLSFATMPRVAPIRFLIRNAILSVLNSFFGSVGTKAK